MVSFVNLRHPVAFKNLDKLTNDLHFKLIDNIVKVFCDTLLSLCRISINKVIEKSKVITENPTVLSFSNNGRSDWERDKRT